MASTPRDDSTRHGISSAGALTLLLAIPALFGCSGQVLVPPDESGAGGGGTGTGGTWGEETCDTGSTSSPPDPAPFALTSVKSGVFIGDTLHLEADVNGVHRYVVLDIDADGVARAVAMPEELLGPANLADVGGGLHARLRVGDSGSAWLDVIDTSDPSAPQLLVSDLQSGEVVPADVFSASEGHFFFCMTPEGGDKRLLHSVNLENPGAPGEPESLESWICDTYEEKSFAAAGSTWMVWSHPTGNFVQDTFVYSVGPDAIENPVNYGYNQTGVHMYGNVVTAATSRERSVFDPENKSLFLVANPNANPVDVNDPGIAWMPLAAGSDARLVGVAGTTVYLAPETGLIAYDLTDLLDPKALPFTANLVPHEGTLRTLATSDRYLAIVDETGTLFLVSREKGGDAPPLVVHAADYVVPPDPAPCTD